MTDFNIYCDESRHTSDPSQQFMVIGGVRCPRDRKHDLVGQIHRLQARHNAHGELGWKRVSPNKAAFYDELLALFANTPDLSFRCIVVDRNKLDYDKFNDGDAELVSRHEKFDADNGGWNITKSPCQNKKDASCRTSQEKARMPLPSSSMP